MFLLSGFNVNLMRSNQHKPTNQYLPYIIQPSRHTNHSRTLMDNIFSDIISKDIICGNITATIFDHVPHFLVSIKLWLSDPPINLMFLKETSQNLPRKIFSWITFI